jgi:hypothetical protein
MGTVLKVIVGGFVLLVVGCGALLYFAYQAGGNVQEDFYTAVLSGDVAKVKGQFHPDLANRVDEPVLEAWMKAVKRDLGAFKGMSTSNFNTSFNQTSNGKEVTSKGIAEFEKGEAESMLKLVDDKIVAWEVKSKSLPSNWFSSLEDASFYDRKARAFLAAILTGDAETAWKFMHPNLQKKFDAADWPGAVKRIQAHYKGETLAFDHHDFKPAAPQEVVMFYGVTGTEGAAIKVRFQRNGMVCHLVGFNIPL